MKAVILTGATGFVGRHIHRALANAGHEVHAVIRTGSADRLCAPARTIETDDLFCESADWWAEKTADADAVIHAAWYVEPGKYLDSARNFDCVTGSAALARGAAQAGVKHFVGVGTCFEYDLPSERLEPDSPLKPATLYAAAKTSLYLMLERFFEGSDTTFSWARLFYLYGEGENPRRLVPHIRASLEAGKVATLSAGTQIRDFLDAAQAGRMIATIPETGQPGAINICSGEAITIRQLAESIADEYGRRDLLEFGTYPIHPSDPKAVVGVCNWRPA